MNHLTHCRSGSRAGCGMGAIGSCTIPIRMCGRRCRMRAVRARGRRGCDMTMKQDGNVNQSYIDLIVEAWHELQEIEAGHAARIDGWHLKRAARSIRRSEE